MHHSSTVRKSRLIFYITYYEVNLSNLGEFYGTNNAPNVNKIYILVVSTKSKYLKQTKMY